MPKIGIRELKNQTAEVLRTVREEQAEYVVTHYGKPVAVIVPITQYERQGSKRKLDVSTILNDRVAAEWDALRNEIGQAWATDLTAAEAVAEQRR